MSPTLLVSLPFILIFFIAQGSKNTKPQAKQMFIDKMANILSHQGGEIIIIHKPTTKKGITPL